MREAFGGEFMLRLMLIFIVIYVSFTALSLNYAKAFRVKNKVLDYLEKNEIQSLDTIIKNDNYAQSLSTLLKKYQYNKECNEGNKSYTNKENKIDYICYNGIVISVDNTQNSDKYYHYVVTTFADWNLGILNKILVFGGRKEDSAKAVDGMFTIKGETKVIKRK